MALIELFENKENGDLYTTNLIHALSADFQIIAIGGFYLLQDLVSYKVIGIIETSFQNIYPHEGTIFAGLQIKAASLRREHTWSKRAKKTTFLTIDRLLRLAWPSQQCCILHSKDHGEGRPQRQGATPLLFSSANSKETARGKHFFCVLVAMEQV